MASDDALNSIFPLLVSQYFARTALDEVSGLSVCNPDWNPSGDGDLCGCWSRPRYHTDSWRGARLESLAKPGGLVTFGFTWLVDSSLCGLEEPPSIGSDNAVDSSLCTHDCANGQLFSHSSIMERD